MFKIGYLWSPPKVTLMCEDGYCENKVTITKKEAFRKVLADIPILCEKCQKEKTI